MRLGCRGIEICSCFLRGGQNGLKIILSKEFRYSNKIDAFAFPKINKTEKTGFRGEQDIDLIVSPFAPNQWRHIFSLRIRADTNIGWI